MGLVKGSLKASLKRAFVLCVLLPLILLFVVKKQPSLSPTTLIPKFVSTVNSLVSVSDNSYFDSISCPVADLCYAGGMASTGHGVLAVTKDGGNSFTFLSAAQSINPINIVQCPSGPVCYLALENQSNNTSQLALTTNGGGTFLTLANGPTNISNFTSISCIADQICMTVGNDVYSNPAIYTTSNEGASFNQSVVPSGLAEISSVSCINSQTCVIGGITDTSSPEVFATTNFGISWQSILLPGTFGKLTGLSCNPNEYCIVTGNSVNAVPVAYSLSLSGLNYSQIQLPSNLQVVSSVSCQSSQLNSMCMAVGQLSNDQPAVISSISNGNFNLISNESFSGLLEGVSCSGIGFCGSLGKAAGVTGLFAGYINGSVLFGDISNALSNLSNLNCLSDGFCVATSSDSVVGSQVLISNDFGATFNPVLTEPGGIMISSLSCPSQSNCFVALNNNGDPNLIDLAIPSYAVSNITLPVNVAAVTGLSCYQATQCDIAGSTLTGQPYVYNTADSGAAWTQVALPISQATIIGISCLSNGGCSLIGTSTSGTATSLYSLNSATSFVQGTLSTVPSNLTSIDCYSTSSCILIGEDQAGDPYIAVSTDSGSSYSIASIAPSNNILKSVSCYIDTAGNLCVVTALVPSNNSSFVYESNNNGANWIQLNQPGGNYPLDSVSCVSSSNCLVIGGLFSELSLALNPVPTISTLSPGNGPIQGGTVVTIQGNFLSGVSSVNFGTSPAASFKVISDNLVQAVSPPSPGGIQASVGVDVVTNVGASNSLNFSYLEIIYNPVTPFRICDTRAPNGSAVTVNQCDTSGASPLLANSTLNIQVTGLGSPAIPSDATAVVVNVTAADTTAAGGFLTVYPTGANRPTASNLNFGPNDTVANLVQVGIGSAGEISVYSFNGSTDIIVDVQGYFAPSATLTNSGGFIPLSPVRVCDTRSTAFSNQCNQNGNGTLGAGATINIGVSGGSYPVPDTATAVVANLTATDTTAAGGFLTAWPGGTIQMPNSSNLNFGAGQSVANRIIIPINVVTGDISIYNFNGTTDIILDVTGYFTSSASSQPGLGFNSIVPTRICDTRPVDVINVGFNQCNLNGAGTFSSGETQTVMVGGIDNIPTNAQAVVANVTSTNTSQNGGYFTVYPTVVPTPSTPPNISDLNWNSGNTVANLVEDGLGATASINVYNYTGQADLIIDVTGYYS